MDSSSRGRRLQKTDWNSRREIIRSLGEKTEIGHANFAIAFSFAHGIASQQKAPLWRHCRGRELGSSVTEFIVASAQQAAAAETIKDFELLTLHNEARDVFVNAVLHPPAAKIGWLFPVA